MVPEDELFMTWLMTGIDYGWISEPVCSTHDGVPLTEAEEQEWEEAGNPCVHVVRLRGVQDG
jgi:hypothetical protein